MRMGAFPHMKPPGSIVGVRTIIDLIVSSLVNGPGVD